MGQPLWEPSYRLNRMPRVQVVPLGAVEGRAPMFYEFVGGSYVKAAGGHAFMLSMTSNSCPVADPHWLPSFVQALLVNATEALFGAEPPLTTAEAVDLLNSDLDHDSEDGRYEHEVPPPPPEATPELLV